MRYGVIADVHANLNALDTVLEALRSAGVERFLCTGDLVGYGPRPNECVARLNEIAAVTVAGNHDLMAVGELSLDRANPHIKRTIDWTRGQLNGTARAYLEALPRETATDDGIVLAHGSLADPTEYVYECRAGQRQLEKLRERFPGAAALLLGHTHFPLACAGDAPLGRDGTIALPPPGTTFLLNAGSVGQSREPRPLARALVLDLEARQAEFLALEYDYEATRRELRDEGLPPDACHLRPKLRRRVRRYLERRLKRA